MVKTNPRTIRLRVQACLATLAISFGCSGSKSTSGVTVEPPAPIYVILSSSPPLRIDPQDPTGTWLATVNQHVQLHATNAFTGQSVDDKVTWQVDPWIRADNPVGTIGSTGGYVAPSSPSTNSVGVSGFPNAVLQYRGYVYIGIVAAPHITGFTAATPTINSGQSASLTPVFENGQGQLLVGSQVIQASLVSGTPVTVSPTATTTYTLKVTNAAGAFVSQDLTITVS